MVNKYVKHADKVDIKTEKVEDVNIFVSRGYTRIKILSLSRRKRTAIAGILFLVVVSLICYAVFHEKRLDNKDLYEKYFSVAQLDLKERFSEALSSSSQKYYYAIYCYHNNKCNEAIRLFKELIETDKFYKESCMWHLAGCYLLINESDEKIVRLLTTLASFEESDYSGLARELLDYKIYKNN